MRIKREHIGDVLVGTNDDQRPFCAVDASGVENVGSVLEVRRVGFLVVDQPEPPLPRQKKRGQILDVGSWCPC